MTGRARRSVLRSLSLGLLLLAGSAEAVLMTFQDKDNGAGAAGAWPNSVDARADWTEAVGTFGLIDFESLTTGHFTSAPVAPGVTVTLTNNDSLLGQGITNIDAPATGPNAGLGFNTTPEGTQHLQVVPIYQSPLNVDVTFTFASPINAFGAYLTGTDSTVPGGNFTLDFDDGTSQSISINENTGSGVCSSSASRTSGNRSGAS